MKNLINKSLSLVLFITILVGTMTVVVAADEKNAAASVESAPFTMYKDEDGYRFTGPLGDLTVVDYDSDDAKSPSYADASKKEIAPLGAENLPSSVDLSQDKYFPPVMNQGALGSCASVSCVYYQFSYAMNRARGIAATYENSASPLFVYNFACEGTELGTTPNGNYAFLKKYGAPSMATVPYNDSGVFSWHPGFDVWREAAGNKLESYTEYDEIGRENSRITSPDDSDLTEFKSLLSQGKVLTFSTTVYSWVANNLKKHPDAPGNDAFEGQYSIKYCDGYQGAHRMTIVGYNDDIWTDINENNRVDSGEMGAFKVANSWGDSYCNGGFVWLAYDALNADKSSVEGVNLQMKVAAVNSVTSIEVRKDDDHSKMYMSYTLNTAKRYQHDVTLVGEKNGTITKERMLYEYCNENPNYGDAFDGTKTACDATFVISLDSVVSGIRAEDFEDYSWSIEIADTKEDGTPLEVLDVKLYNEFTGEVYTTARQLPVTLDGEKAVFDIKETTSDNKVIYYTGFDNPILCYRVGEGEFLEMPMEANTEREKYVNKALLADTPEDVTLYFRNEKGQLDDNDGQYYVLSDRLGFFTTDDVAEELKINGISFINGDIDIEKLMKISIDTTGGYEPYHYKMSVKNLTTGAVTDRSYEYMWYIQEPGYVFRTMDPYEFYFEVMDHTGKTAGYTVVIEPTDLPFEFETLTAQESVKFVGESIHFTVKSLNEGVFSHGSSKNIYNFEIKDEAGNICFTHSQNSDFSDMNERYSINYLEYIPEKSGEYTLTVSSTDVKKQTAEISLQFTVIDKIIGDSNADAVVNIKDATLIQKYIADLVDESQIYLNLADCDTDPSVNIKDVTMIQKYVADISECGNVGNIIPYIPPEKPEEPSVTEPTTPAATETPTEPVTSNPKENRKVTFTNSLGWSGTIYCYYWSSSNTAMTSWPGVAMTGAGLNEFNQGLYTFEVPEGAEYIIFSGTGGQTVDIAYGGGEVRYYACDTKSGNGYDVKTW